MNLDEFKKKAEEISQSFQDSVLPEIKKKTESLKEKTGEIKDDFMDRTSDFRQDFKTKSGEIKEELKEKSGDLKDMLKEKRDDIKDAMNNKDSSENEEEVEKNDKEDEVEKVEGEVVDHSEDEKDEPEKPSEEIERVQGTVVGSFRDKFDHFTSSTLPNVKQKTSEVYNVVAPKVKNKAGEIADYVSPKVKSAVSTMGDKLKKAGPSIKEKAKDAADEVSFQSYRVKKKAKQKTGDAIKKSLRENLFPNGEGTEKKSRTAKTDGNKKEAAEAKKPANAVMHAKTIMEHRHLVFEHCVKAGIPLQGLTHDLSKFSPAEFLYGVKFFQGDRSPNEGEREDHGYSNAWMHHKGRNKHHFEYWLDYNIDANKAIPVKMPLKYVIEMFCDRVAAGKVYLKDKYTDRAPLDYFEKGRARRNIHPETSDFLEKLLKMLAKKGEDYTFMYIRWFMKHHDDY